MPASVVSISNMALSRIGTRSSITSLNEASTEALHCKLLFDQARDATLEAHDWVFARKRVALADLGTPPGGWSHRYALPSDCIAPRFLETGTRTERRASFRIEGRDLLADTDGATLVYTARITDPALFPPSFASALSWGLGAELAIPLTGKESLHQRCAQMWQSAINTAAVNDANADAPDETPDALWIAARG
jgi:hypothetical protein